MVGYVKEEGCVYPGGDKISLDPIDSINLDPENFHPRFFLLFAIIVFFRREWKRERK